VYIGVDVTNERVMDVFAPVSSVNVTSLLQDRKNSLTFVHFVPHRRSIGSHYVNDAQYINYELHTSSLTSHNDTKQLLSFSSQISCISTRFRHFQRRS
jgi:hypothetical protein